MCYSDLSIRLLRDRVNTGTFIDEMGSSSLLTFQYNGVGFDNFGSVDVQSGSVQFSTYTQTAGVTTLDGGAIASSMPLDIQGGLLDGSGNISGGVNDGGTTSPGSSSPGSIAVSADYTQTSAGQLTIGLRGTTAGYAI